MTRDPTAPLTPEERELAMRLARVATPGEPSPALDSRILAAARAAVDGPATPAQQPRRWPVMFGVAASLALAVGIAWQLRPLPDATIEYSEAPAAASTDTTSAIAGDDAKVAPEQTADAAGGPATAQRTHPASPDATAAAEAAEPVPQAFPPPPQAKVASAAQAEAAAVAETPAVVPVAPPPAPPAPVAATEAAGAARARDAAQRDSTAPQAAAGNRQDAGGLAPREASTATGEYGDQSIDDQPPATADAPEVRQAWLQRIRELIAAGETDAARASLDEFKRRYPDAVLPEDLRAFGK